MTRTWLAAAVALGFAATTARDLDAHKPITSPFTYSAEVGPILQQRCGRCHAPGGVAPMSLLTHRETVPWGESMRGELLTGQMPPWTVDRGASRFRNPGGLTARELNVLLTWLSGGTPAGDPGTGIDPAPPSTWPLGMPDEVVTLPAVTIGAEEQQLDTEFTIAPADGVRALRAIDILPGTPAVLRGATIAALDPKPAPAGREERLLSLWVPGDEASAPAAGVMRIPAGAPLRVSLRYRKTWEYERRAMRDQSRVGLYFSTASAPVLQALPVTARAPVTLSRSSRVVAIYPDPLMAETALVITAVRPDGRREEVMAFRPRRGWARRFWMREPLSLPRGTRLELRTAPGPPALLPPGFTRPAPAASPSPARVYVNVVG